MSLIILGVQCPDTHIFEPTSKYVVPETGLQSLRSKGLTAILTLSRAKYDLTSDDRSVLRSSVHTYIYLTYIPQPAIDLFEKTLSRSNVQPDTLLLLMGVFTTTIQFGWATKTIIVETNKHEGADWLNGAIGRPAGLTQPNNKLRSKRH